jgi:exosome complex exonuclease RRP4-like protein
MHRFVPNTTCPPWYCAPGVVQPAWDIMHSARSSPTKALAWSFIHSGFPHTPFRTPFAWHCRKLALFCAVLVRTALCCTARQPPYTQVRDVVVGRIKEVGSKRWRVDIAGRQDASLQLSGIQLQGGVLVRVSPLWLSSGRVSLSTTTRRHGNRTPD